jgi:hypothetical protein
VALRRDGSLHVRISCPHGCRSGSRPSGVQIVSPHWLHVRSRSHGVTRYTQPALFNLKPGGHATVRIPLTKSQIRTLRRHGHTRARLKVTGQQIYQPRIIRTMRAR